MSDATPEKSDRSATDSAPTADPTLDPAEASGSATGQVTSATSDAKPAGAQVVYVTAPIPPRPRGNRIVGVLLALLGAVLFALAYLGVVSLMIVTFLAPDSAPERIRAFLSDAAFWVPILFFALGFVLVVLLLNRAAWWAHVLGSILVALIVYFGTIGMLLLINNVGLGSAKETSRFSVLAVNPVIIAAGLVAREVSIWVGFLIAVRGRRVTARNREERAAFDREQARVKAEREAGAAQS